MNVFIFHYRQTIIFQAKNKISPLSTKNIFIIYESLFTLSTLSFYLLIYSMTDYLLLLFVEVIDPFIRTFAVLTVTQSLPRTQLQALQFGINAK